MTLEHKTTHADEVPGLLIEVLKEKPNFLAWILSYVNRVQELEDAIWDVYVGRFLDNAVGVQLDGLGEIVGAPRNGRDDETYRVRLRVQIRLNYGSGRGEDIIAAFQLVLQESTQFLTLREAYPAELTLDLRAPFSQAVIDELLEILGEAKGAAVRAQMRYYLQSISRTFRFSTTATPTLGSGRGFGGGLVLGPTAAIDPAQTSAYESFVTCLPRLKNGATNGSGTWVFPALNASHKADGVFVSTNGGQTFTRLLLTDNINLDVLVCKYDGAKFYIAAVDDATATINYVYSSTDGLTWVSATVPASASIQGLAAVGGTVVVACDDNSLYTSTDGGATFSSTHTFTSASAFNVVWNSVLKIFVALAASHKLATSPDGVTWTDRTVPGTLGNLSFCEFNAAGYMLVAADNGFVASSPDGITWTDRGQPGGTAAGVQNLLFHGGYFWHENAGHTYRTTDGSAWTLFVEWNSSTGTLHGVGHLLVHVDNQTENKIQWLCYPGPEAANTWSGQLNLASSSITPHAFAASDRELLGLQTASGASGVMNYSTGQLAGAGEGT